MENEKKSEKRDVLTLGWRSKGAAAVRVDDYREIASASVAPVRVIEPVAPEVVDVADCPFEKRMDNWRKTVRGSIGGGDDGCCAQWARLYVAARLKRELEVQAAVGIQPLQLVRVSVDELDGWMVEAAVRALGDFNQMMVLRLHYVWQYPEHWIKTRLMLRKSGIRLIKSRAENNLQKVFTRLENAAKILSNNLHAGNFPRPESTDALVGAPLTLEKDKALIE